MPGRRLGRRRQSLANRVTAFSAIAVGISVTVLSLSAYVTVRHQMYSSLDSSLMSRATDAANASITADLADREVADWIVGAADVQIAVVSSTGQVVAAGHNAAGFSAALGNQEFAVARGESSSSLRTADTPAGRFRVVTVPSATHGQALVLAQSLAPTEETLHDLGVVMVLLGALGVLFAAVAGALVARQGLKPVRSLTTALETVARTETLTPIEVSGDDELGRLAASFNAMIASLSASRDLQAQLVTDASHELRTPLTSVRTNLDLLQQAEVGMGLDPRARIELLADVSAQIEELTKLIGSLAELARGGSPYGADQRVELHEVVDRAVERFRREDHGLEIRATIEEWTVEGEDSALERAVGNLLDNAVTWSPPGGTIWVTLSQGRLKVEDEGPGVDPQDVPYVFDRFYRAMESRGLPGSGLGLSVVRHVVERHGGTVSVERSAHGGAAFVIDLSAQRTDRLTVKGTGAHSERSATRANVET